MAWDGTSLLWLLVVLAAIPATLWLVRRTPLGQGGAAGTARTVAVLPLSTTQRVVTVEVGRGERRLWLVLGGTPQGIQTLSAMTPEDDPQAEPPATPAATLAPLLDRLRRPPGGGGR